MAYSDANLAELRIIEEATWGTTPAAGNTRALRLTSSSLTANKETAISDELRSDRMVGSITEVAASSNGDINFEWSTGPYDELLGGFLLNTWTRPMSQDFWKGTILSVTSPSTLTVAGEDLTGYLTAGRRMKMAGWSDVANTGYFSIASVTYVGADTVIVMNEVTLVTEAGTSISRAYDANDVIVLNDVNISSTANGFSSGGTNAFAAAILAEQLVVGQKIFVGGDLGNEVGTVVITGTLSTSSLTFTDGINTATLVAAADYTVGVTTDADGAALTAAINALRSRVVDPVNIKAVYDTVTDTITITNLESTGGAITETIADAVATVTTFAGGTAGVTGMYTITTLADDLMGVTPTLAAVPAGAPVTIKGSHLRNATDIANINQRSFTIETGYTDIDIYQEQTGMVPSTFSLDIASGSIITGTIGFEGRETSMQTGAKLGILPYTPLDAQAGEVVNATTDLGDLTKDGAPMAACLQSLSLSGEAGLRTQTCIGSKFPSGIGTGRFNLSGSMTVYFEDATLFTDFLDHNTISLSFSITDIEGAVYYFTIPAVKISQDAIAPGGIDQDVMETLEWVAFGDTTTGTMFQVDRFSPNTAV